MSDTESQYADDHDVVALDAVLVVGEQDEPPNLTAILASPLRIWVEIEMVPGADAED